MAVFQLQLFERVSKLFRRRSLRRPKAKTNRVIVKTSDQMLKSIWCELRLEFFPEQPEIDDYVVFWSSRRQKRVLACCHIQRRQVRVAKELRYSEYTNWLSPLLYHEMCHAALGTNVPRERGKRAWHGREFKRLVVRHKETHAMEAWIKSGGWLHAVRSDRAKDTAKKKRSERWA